MRVAVFAVVTVSVLSGVSAYADRMIAPSRQAEEMTVASPVTTETQSVADVSSAQFLDVQTNPQTTAPATPAAVTPEPSSVVLMATGFIGVGGMLWRRRSLTR